MNEQKIEKLAKIILVQSQYYQNYIAKFGFVSMLDYQAQTTNIVEKEIIIQKPISTTLYILDIEKPHQYLNSLLKQEIFPIPLFHHIWHQQGNVGSSQMYNTLLEPNLYLKLSETNPNFDIFCFVFDGDRYTKSEISDPAKYDNMWTVYDEMLPPSGYLEQLNITQVKLICDHKRSDLIISCTNLYGDLLEVEVI